MIYLHFIFCSPMDNLWLIELFREVGSPKLDTVFLLIKWQAPVLSVTSLFIA